jgi:hypothetical protein
MLTDPFEIVMTLSSMFQEDGLQFKEQCDKKKGLAYRTIVLGQRRSHY